MAKAGAGERTRKQFESLVESWVPERVRRAVRHVVEEVEGDELLLRAAALAFYAFVAMVPLLVVTAWFFSLFMNDREIAESAKSVGRFAPDSTGFDTVFTGIAKSGTSLGVQAFVLSLVPATAYGAGLARTFDGLAGTEERRFPGLQGRGLGLVFLAVMPLLTVGGLVAAYAGTKVLGDGPVLTVLGFALTLVFGFGASGAAVALVYRLFPSEPPDRRPLLRAAAVAGGLTAALSTVYVVYVRVGTNFQSRYGTSTIAAAILFVLWLFLANLILITTYRLVALADRGSG